VAKIPVLLAIPPLLFAGLSRAEPVGARDLVRQSIQAEMENSKRAKNYTFLHRTEEREMDDNHQVKSSHSTTYDVTMLAGSSYRRLVERDDRPLPPKEAKREQEKLRESIEARRRETEAQREKRIAEYDNRPGRNRAMLREIPDAFDFRIIAEESANGRPVYVVEGLPHPGYRATSSEGRMILPHLKITAWIDKADRNWVQLHAEVVDPISWALCLVRLAPGAQFELRRTYVNNEVWMPQWVRVTASARVALFKKVSKQEEHTFKNFRRFQTDSQILATSEVR
jgi:hypothetical protein